MKTVLRGFSQMSAVLLVFTASFFAVQSCTGIAARDNVLMPLTAEHYESVVMPLALEGAGTDQGLKDNVTQFLGVLKRGDRDEIDPFKWLAIRILAGEGIVLLLQKEEIGPNGAEILRESVNRIDANIQRLVSR